MGECLFKKQPIKKSYSYYQINMEKRVRVRDVDSYLNEIPEPGRSTLMSIRAIIKDAVPEAEEVISYQIPTFKFKGSLVGYAAFKKHCSFFVMSSSLIKSFENQLTGYETTKGAIHFPLDKPLPSALVKAIIKARIDENTLLFRMKNK